MTVTKEGTEQSVSNANNGIRIEDSDLYPERRGQKQRSWINKILRVQEREELDKVKCEMNVYNCVKNSKNLYLLFKHYLSSSSICNSKIFHLFLNILNLRKGISLIFFKLLSVLAGKHLIIK